MRILGNLYSLVLVLGGKPRILKGREIFCNHTPNVTRTHYTGTLQFFKLLRFTGGWQEHLKASGSAYILSCTVSERLNKTRAITACQAFYSQFCLWPVAWTRVKHSPCTWVCSPVRGGNWLPGGPGFLNYLSVLESLTIALFLLSWEQSRQSDSCLSLLSVSLLSASRRRTDN